MNSQTSIRKTMRQQRRELSVAQQKKSARQIWRQIRRLSSYRKARRIAFYLPNDGELDLSMVLRNAMVGQKDCYLPVLVRGEMLRFAPASLATRFRKNKFGISEPVYSPRWLKAARQIDLILMPLVAFDEQGNRMGMGGGYYDRSLSFKRHRSHLPPTLIGAAHDFQRLERLEPEPWDVPMDGVVSPAGYYRARR